MTDAVAVYQEYLDTVSHLVWEGRFEESCDRMLFPNEVWTLDAMVRNVSREDMVLNLRSFRDSIVRQGAQSYYRLCRGAQVDPMDADRIVGTHRSYVLRGGTYVLPPYDSRMVMRRVDGRWLASRLQSMQRNAVLGAVSPQLRWEVPPDGWMNWNDGGDGA